jgi:hypothetical protein
LVVQRFGFRVAFVVLVAFAPTVSLCQTPTPATQNSSQPATAPQTSVCAPLADTSIAVNSTVEAKVTGIDSAHLKTGKEIWFKVAHGVIYSGCTLEPDSVVYAHILSATGAKGATSSELSLSFDHADCSGHDKQPLKLRLIAIVGPPDAKHNMHEDMPTQVAGGARRIDDAVAGTNALDMELNPGGPPHTVRPGIVVGVPNLKLEPTAGPDCSDKMTSTNSKIQLGPGSELILAMTQTR